MASIRHLILGSLCCSVFIYLISPVVGVQFHTVIGNTGPANKCTGIEYPKSDEEYKALGSRSGTVQATDHCVVCTSKSEESCAEFSSGHGNGGYGFALECSPKSQIPPGKVLLTADPKECEGKIKAAMKD